MSQWLETVELIGGALCLDFANTVTWRTGDAPIERLENYDDLARWLRRTEVLASKDALELAALARKSPKHAGATLRSALGFREAIYQTFSAIAHEREPAVADIEEINRMVRRTFSQAKLVHTADHFHLAWGADRQDLEQALWPIAHSVVKLMTSPELHKVRECAGERCGWLFVDRSRNHLRRWCSMRDCGNRAKARHHYQRSRLA